MRRSLFVLARLVMLSTLVLAIAPFSLHAQDKKQRGDRNLITMTELAESYGSFNTAHDVIRAMRPQWLNPPRGHASTLSMMGGGNGSSTKEVVVYIDDVRQQSLDDLKTLKSTQLVELRFLDQNRAIQLHGPGHEMGVIEVSTVNKRK